MKKLSRTLLSVTVMGMILGQGFATEAFANREKRQERREVRQENRQERRVAQQENRQERREARQEKRQEHREYIKQHRQERKANRDN